MAMKPTQRLSDTEREAYVDRLRVGMSEGRLDVDEFQSRLDAAYSAKTHGEIVVLTSDLPPVAKKRPSRRRRLRRRLRTYLGVNAVCWGVWGAQLATGGSAHDLWPLWVTIPWGAWLLV